VTAFDRSVRCSYGRPAPGSGTGIETATASGSEC
jgi:hypothetical protein